MHKQSPSREQAQSPKRSSKNADSEIENQKLRVELEHHKNLLIGLNEKLTVFNDLKQDLE